jgi:hypothetical protein
MCSHKQIFCQLTQLIFRLAPPLGFPPVTSLNLDVRPYEMVLRLLCSAWTPPTTAGTSSFPNLSPEDIFPLPKVSQEQKRLSRKRGKTAILTSSPYKEELVKVQQKAKKNRKQQDILFWKRLLNQTQEQRPIGLHDFHSPQRPPVKVKNRMKITSVSTLVMFIHSLLQDGPMLFLLEVGPQFLCRRW